MCWGCKDWSSPRPPRVSCLPTRTFLLSQETAGCQIWSDAWSLHSGLPTAWNRALDSAKGSVRKRKGIAIWKNNANQMRWNRHLIRWALLAWRRKSESSFEMCSWRCSMGKRVGSKDFYSGVDAQFQRRRTFNCTLQINTCMFTLKLVIHDNNNNDKYAFPQSAIRNQESHRKKNSTAPRHY